MNNLYIVLLCVAVAVTTITLMKLLDYLRRRDAESEAARILERAEQEVAARRREAELEIKEIALRQKTEGEQELREIREELHARERSLDKREDTLEQQVEQLHKQEKIVEGSQRKLTERIQEANQRKEELSKLLDLQRQTLHELSGLSREDATRRLLASLESQLRQESGAVIAKHEKELADTCEQKSREVLLTSLQRYAAAHTAETTTSTVDIPNDEMKGRIIGREGRNIRAFEKATGVDVIIDDTPGVVIVSAFDMIRREVARLCPEQAHRRRPNPPFARIEEIVAETLREQEIERHVQRAGEDRLPGGRRPRPARTDRQPASDASSSGPATARTCCGTRSRSLSSGRYVGR